MPTSYGLIIEFWGNEKLQKYKIILSQQNIYSHKWLADLNFDVYCCMFIFFSVRSLNICHISSDGLANLDWHFMEMDKHNYQTGCSWWTQVGLVPCNQKFSCKLNITLQSCPTKQAAFLPGQPTPYSQLIIQAVLIVPKCYLAKNVLDNSLSVRLWTKWLRVQVQL